MESDDIKVALAQLLAGTGGVTPSELAARLGWSVLRTEHVLLQLQAQGLVEDEGVTIGAAGEARNYGYRG
jgi:hypothetical protein